MAEEPRGGLKTAGRDLFEILTGKARCAARGRAHHRLHPGPGDPVQRMCVAAEPGSYFRPHRHPAPGRWELFAVLRGASAILIFDDDGTVLDRVELSGDGETGLVEIPPGRWHALAALRPGTVLLEVKPGPYVPEEDKEFAPWSPAEGSAAAPACEVRLRRAGIGDRCAGPPWRPPSPA